MSDWRSYFGYGPSNAVTEADLRQRYRRMAFKLHPNKGGSTTGFQALGQMHDRALKNLAAAAAAAAASALNGSGRPPNTPPGNRRGSSRCPLEARRQLRMTRCVGRYLDAQCRIKCAPMEPKPAKAYKPPKPAKPYKVSVKCPPPVKCKCS